jgi:hypothetical protein
MLFIHVHEQMQLHNIMFVPAHSTCRYLEGQGWVLQSGVSFYTRRSYFYTRMSYVYTRVSYDGGGTKFAKCSPPACTEGRGINQIWLIPAPLGRLWASICQLTYPPPTGNVWGRVLQSSEGVWTLACVCKS